jgi:hypothetical protein
MNLYLFTKRSTQCFFPILLARRVKSSRNSVSDFTTVVCGNKQILVHIFFSASVRAGTGFLHFCFALRLKIFLCLPVVQPRTATESAGR